MVQVVSPKSRMVSTFYEFMNISIEMSVKGPTSAILRDTHLIFLGFYNKRNYSFDH